MSLGTFRLYREFSTQEELDRVYNPSMHVPEMPAIVDGWIERSERVRQDLTCALGVPFGPTLAEYVDVFPAAEGAPVHLFIHGGYWRRFSARDHSFLARPLVEAGVCTVIVNYALAPIVTVEEIVRQVRAAFAWTWANIERFGGDRTRITGSGHSAGGHLVAMAAASLWRRDYGLPDDLIKAAIPISGVFDLTPLPFTYIQPAVQLTGDQIRRISPIDHLPNPGTRMLVAVGGDETSEFRRQSRDYHERCEAAGLSSRYLEPASKNHFTVLGDLEDRDSELYRALLDMTRETP